MTDQLPRISHRIASIAESATLKVDAKAKSLQAAGRPVVSYAAGEPDFPTPPHIVEAASAAVLDPKNHRYTPAAGLPELREAIAAKTLRDSGVEVSPAQVIVTNGGKQAVYQSFATLLDPGDEVLVPTPFWTTYPEAIRLAGGVPVEVFAGSDQDYLVTVEQLEAAMTGWRVGWMVGPLDAIKAASNLQSHLSSNVSNVSQRAAIAALNGPQDTVETMRSTYDRRRRLIVDGLNAIDGVHTPLPQGAFYVYPDVTGLLGRTWGGVTPTTSLELADLILEQVEVATVPGEAFGPSGFLRLSYALGDDALAEGVARLQRLFG